MIEITEKKIRLVITDDHLLFRTGVKNSLAKYPDLEIIGEAENGQQLLQLLDYLKPDMITLGIQMPVMDGLTTLPILKKHYPHIKVIMFSMHNDPGVICKMLELGANTYLTKEAGSVDIYKTIQALQSRYFYINETVRKAISSLKPEMTLVPEPLFTEKEILMLKLLKNNIGLNDIANKVDLSQRTVLAILDKMQTKASVKSLSRLLEFAEKKKLF